MRGKMDCHDYIKLAEDYIKKRLKDTSHDYYHTLRVRRIARRLSEGLPADFCVVELCVILHDIAREEEDRDETGKIDHAELGAREAEELLLKWGASRELAARVKECIRRHRFKRGLEPRTLEEKIVYDADKIDVLGAIGIARSFMIAGRYGQNVWEVDFDLEEYVRKNIVNGRIKDIRRHSPLKEYLIKFVKIPERLYTKKGKELARERLKLMEEFFDEFVREVRGEA